MDITPVIRCRKFLSFFFQKVPDERGFSSADRAKSIDIVTMTLYLNPELYGPERSILTYCLFERGEFGSTFKVEFARIAGASQVSFGSNSVIFNAISDPPFCKVRSEK
jgi:hypothetical protein